MMKRILLLVALFSLSGCAMQNATPGKLVTVGDVIPAPDEPTIGVRKADFSPDTWIYRHPQISPRDYAKIMLPPVHLYENMSSEVKKRDRRNLDEVGETFRNRMIRLLEKDYLPVDEPDPQTLRIEIELFALKANPKIFKDRHEKIKLGSGVAGTKLEAGCYDSVTGELIFAVSTFYEGEEYAAYANPVLIKNLRGAFGEWSEHFKKRFDEVMTFDK